MIKDGLFIVNKVNADLTLRLEKAFDEYLERMGVPPTAAVVHSYLLKEPRQIPILGRLLSVDIGPIDRFTTWIGQADCHCERSEAISEMEISNG
jgi:hypothetical protein